MHMYKYVHTNIYHTHTHTHYTCMVEVNTVARPTGYGRQDS